METLINIITRPKSRYVQLIVNYIQILNSDNHSLNIQLRAEALQSHIKLEHQSIFCKYLPSFVKKGTERPRLKSTEQSRLKATKHSRMKKGKRLRRSRYSEARKTRQKGQSFSPAQILPKHFGAHHRIERYPIETTRNQN